MLDKSHGLALFTDGSSYYKDRSGGWAWAAIDAFDGEETGSGSTTDTTSSRMEMVAWIKGLDYLYQSLGPCKILVYSDSQYVGYGAMDRTRKRKKNGDLWLQIDAAIDRHEYVEYVWVKGHAESHYNDLVDQLASTTRKEKVNYEQME